jgi:hypothetical protein
LLGLLLLLLLHCWQHPDRGVQPSALQVLVCLLLVFLWLLRLLLMQGLACHQLAREQIQVEDSRRFLSAEPAAAFPA